jgi:hypothetical protein
VLNDSNSLSAGLFFAPLATRGKSTEFYTSKVKSLCFTYFIPQSEIILALSVCRGITSLACWARPIGGYAHDPELIRLVTSLPLRSISIQVQSFYPILDPDFRTFSTIKYMCICDESGAWTEWSWKGISLLKNLTHLALFTREWDAEKIEKILWALQRLLFHCKFLRVCPILTCGYRVEGLNEWLADIDIRLVALPRCADMIGSWIEHTRGEFDYWARAEAIVEQRQVPCNKARNIVTRPS